MESQGFLVSRHYLEMDTAWRAAFSHSQGGRVIGVNCEMDALPGIGHACGHNLIAVAGVAVAVAIKAALVQYNIPGTIVVLGTPGSVTGYLYLQILSPSKLSRRDWGRQNNPPRTRRL